MRVAGLLVALASTTSALVLMSAPGSEKVMTAPGVEKVPLAAILSTCADAASRGCEEIRAVHSKRIAGDGSVTYKSDDARDALTEADLRAQEASPLRARGRSDSCR